MKEDTFFIVGVGWAGASEGRDMSKFFTNWEGKTCFIRNRERVKVFLARKKLLYVVLLTLTC